MTALNELPPRLAADSTRLRVPLLRPSEAAELLSVRPSWIYEAVRTSGPRAGRSSVPTPSRPGDHARAPAWLPVDCERPADFDIVRTDARSGDVRVSRACAGLLVPEHA